MKKRKRQRQEDGPAPFRWTHRPTISFVGIALVLGALVLGGIVLFSRDSTLDCTRIDDGAVRCEAISSTVFGAERWTAVVPKGSVIESRCTSGKNVTCRVLATPPGKGEGDVIALSRATSGSSDSWRVKNRLGLLLAREGPPAMNERWGQAPTPFFVPVLMLAFGLVLSRWRTEVVAEGAPPTLTIRRLQFPFSKRETFPLARATKFERSDAGFLEMRPPEGTPVRLFPFPASDALVTQLQKELRRATPRS